MRVMLDETFPDDWPDLTVAFKLYLSSSSGNIVMGALVGFYETAKRFPYVVDCSTDTVIAPSVAMLEFHWSLLARSGLA